jgi:hypothetical protein
VTVIVEEPPAVTEAGLKLTFVPAGAPLALRATDCAEPFVTAVEMVEVELAPCPMLRVLGFAEIEKSLPVAPQPPSLNDPIRVCQLKLPFAGRYSSVYQKVQSSLGSTAMLV